MLFYILNTIKKKKKSKATSYKGHIILLDHLWILLKLLWMRKLCNCVMTI